jgi:acyl-CoA thioesterase-1
MRSGSWQRRDFIASLLAACVAAPATAAGAPVILVVGDSLSAEYGLKRGSGWVALLERRLAQQNVPAKVVNASISGDTASAGRARLPALLAQHKPTHVVIELGANDGLRGLPIPDLQADLSAMVQAAQKAGAKVVLVGMQMPPNYGGDYARRFAAVFGAVAKQYRTGFVPFLLAGVADAPEARELFQADGIHPRAEAHPRILDNVWPELKKQLR